MAIPQFDLIEIITISILSLSWCFQLWFLLKRIRPLAVYRPSPVTSSTLPPVSVIICAKDEDYNLSLFLPEILTQDYPNYQVVVVNDNSEDDTSEILQQFKNQYPHLYTTTLSADKKFYNGKKTALSIGIKAAVHEHLILTDADCRPASNQWLKHMVEALTQPGKEMVLGIGNYEKQKGLANFWIRYDTFSIALQYLGYALSGKPYMGVGRNLGYTKSLFVNNNGFKNHLMIMSGDDDLFVQEVASQSNTTICIHPQAHTMSVPAGSFSKWKNQKQRHLTTAGRYPFGIRMELTLEPITRELFWIFSLYYLFFNNFVVIGLAFWGSLMTTKYILWRMAAKKTGLGNIYWGFIGFDFLQPLLLLWAHAGNLTGTKKKKWK